METPRQGRHDGPFCEIEIFAALGPALTGVGRFERLGSAVLAAPVAPRSRAAKPGIKRRGAGHRSLRSPVRPTSIVALETIEGNRLFVRGLDCLDGTRWST